MIKIVKIDTDEDTRYDKINCPNCGVRLCDKPSGVKVSMLYFKGKKSADKFSHVLIKCNKCGNRYMITTDENIK